MAITRKDGLEKGDALDLILFSFLTIITSLLTLGSISFPSDTSLDSAKNGISYFSNSVFTYNTELPLSLAFTIPLFIVFLFLFIVLAIRRSRVGGHLKRPRIILLILFLILVFLYGSYILIFTKIPAGSSSPYEYTLQLFPDNTEELTKVLQLVAPNFNIQARVSYIISLLAFFLYIYFLISYYRTFYYCTKTFTIVTNIIVYFVIIAIFASMLVNTGFREQLLTNIKSTFDISSNFAKAQHPFISNETLGFLLFASSFSAITLHYHRPHFIFVILGLIPIFASYAIFNDYALVLSIAVFVLGNICVFTSKVSGDYKGQTIASFIIMFLVSATFVILFLLKNVSIGQQLNNALGYHIDNLKKDLSVSIYRWKISFSSIFNYEYHFIGFSPYLRSTLLSEAFNAFNVSFYTSNPSSGLLQTFTDFGYIGAVAITIFYLTLFVESAILFFRKEKGGLFYQLMGLIIGFSSMVFPHGLGVFDCFSFLYMIFYLLPFISDYHLNRVEVFYGDIDMSEVNKETETEREPIGEDRKKLNEEENTSEGNAFFNIDRNKDEVNQQEELDQNIEQKEEVEPDSVSYAEDARERYFNNIINRKHGEGNDTQGDDKLPKEDSSLNNIENENISQDEENNNQNPIFNNVVEKPIEDLSQNEDEENPSEDQLENNDSLDPDESEDNEIVDLDNEQQESESSPRIRGKILNKIKKNKNRQEKEKSTPVVERKIDIEENVIERDHHDDNDISVTRGISLSDIKESLNKEDNNETQKEKQEINKKDIGSTLEIDLEQLNSENKEEPKKDNDSYIILKEVDSTSVSEEEKRKNNQKEEEKIIPPSIKLKDVEPEIDTDYEPSVKYTTSFRKLLSQENELIENKPITGDEIDESLASTNKSNTTYIKLNDIKEKLDKASKSLGIPLNGTKNLDDETEEEPTGSIIDRKFDINQTNKKKERSLFETEEEDDEPLINEEVAHVLEHAINLKHTDSYPKSSKVIENKASVDRLSSTLKEAPVEQIKTKTTTPLNTAKQTNIKPNINTQNINAQTRPINQHTPKQVKVNQNRPNIKEPTLQVRPNVTRHANQQNIQSTFPKKTITTSQQPPSQINPNQAKPQQSKPYKFDINDFIVKTPSGSTKSLGTTNSSYLDDDDDTLYIDLN